jgi:hypothetical protein
MGTRGRRIMANMSAFQANDASSILAARTNIKNHDQSWFFILVRSDEIELASACIARQMRVRATQ